jgi:hypothetical protein
MMVAGVISTGGVTALAAKALHGRKAPKELSNRSSEIKEKQS